MIKHTKRIIVRRETFERVSLIGAAGNETVERPTRCPQCGTEISHHTALPAAGAGGGLSLTESSGDDLPV